MIYTLLVNAIPAPYSISDTSDTQQEVYSDYWFLGMSIIFIIIIIVCFKDDHK